MGGVSLQFIDALRGSKIFDVAETVTSRQQLTDAIVAGRVSVAFDIPPNFTADVRAGRAGQVQALIDGSDSTIAQPTYAAATAIAAAISLPVQPAIAVVPRVLFNPSMRSANFLVPGLIGVIMQLITMFLTSLSIVGERERGTSIKSSSPGRRPGLMLGKITPYAAIGFLDMLFVLWRCAGYSVSRSPGACHC